MSLAFNKETHWIGSCMNNLIFLFDMCWLFFSLTGVGFIDDIRLDTARRGFSGEEESTWIESCTCPDGYVGQFCESCAPGFKRSPPNGGPFASCIPCECNGHGDQCDPESGRLTLVCIY